MNRSAVSRVVDHCRRRRHLASARRAPADPARGRRSRASPADRLRAAKRGPRGRRGADGSELLEAIAALVIDGARPFDVIISAQAIPGIPGVSVLAGLRSRGRRTPFVLMTGNPVVKGRRDGWAR